MWISLVGAAGTQISVEAEDDQALQGDEQVEEVRLVVAELALESQKYTQVRAGRNRRAANFRLGRAWRY